MNRNYTLCVVGFCAGKSSLVARFIKPKVRWEQLEADVGHDPTTTASHHTQLTANGAIINVNILDTNGLEAYKENREEAIAKSHGILLCYSICYRNTFEQLYRFLDEIVAVKGSLNIPIMLVGTMYDRESERTVLPEEGVDLADFLGCRSIETSAKTGTHVTDCFFNLLKEVLRLERKQSARQISLSTSSQSLSSGVDLIAPKQPQDDLKKKKKRSDSKGEKLFKSMLGNTQTSATKEKTETSTSTHMNQMSSDMKESSSTRRAILKEWLNLIGLDSSSYRLLKKISVKSIADLRFVAPEDLSKLFHLFLTFEEDWQPVSRDKFLHYTAEDSDLSFLLDIGINNPFFPIWFLNGKRISDSILERIIQIITTWKFRVTGLNLQDNEITNLNLVAKLLQNTKELVLLNITNNPFKVTLSDLVPFIETWRNVFKKNDVLHYLLVWNTSTTYSTATAAFGELRKHLRSIQRKHIRICVYQWQVHFIPGLSELLRLIDSHTPMGKPDIHITVPQDSPIDMWIEVHRLKDASKVIKTSGVKFVKDLRFMRPAQLEELTPFLRNKVWYLMQIASGVLPKGYRYDLSSPQTFLMPVTLKGTIYRPMPGPENNNNNANATTQPQPSQPSNVTTQPQPIPASPVTPPSPIPPVAVSDPPVQPIPPVQPEATRKLSGSPLPQANPANSTENAAPSPTTARLRAASASTSGRKLVVGEDITISNMDEECLINYSELSFEKILGTGSYGVVYKALYRYQAVAVKQLHAYNFKSYSSANSIEYNNGKIEEPPKFKLTQEEMDQFYHEAELMKNLRPHTNVVLFLGICCEPPCIVTEYLPGGTVESLLKNTSITLTLPTILGYALDTAAGLHHLHKENVIHRDLATRNLLITDTGRVKIADFGMSRFVNNSTGQTKSNTGPLRWMSPERTYSKHSDMWAFGCVVVELLTRDVPFPNLTPLEAAYQVAFQSATPSVPESIMEGSNSVPVPSALQTIIRECFDHTPEVRPNADTMCSRLLRLKQHLSPQKPDENRSASSSNEEDSWTVVPLVQRQSSLILSSSKVQQPTQAEIDRKKVEEELEDVINYLLDS